ncbi:hypothetical protein BV25DRAFT_1829380 [Artomyces pyxidatus]|uniref:Uncharacterized protein n=1 Tax=Artomyces pyxidatus TaxID=48021 RepID=A0ACB8STL8_9AGAM|nr:hypothetical protein BV25DRAFT_1829380 [Artomyces pyxidatus]
MSVTALSQASHAIVTFAFHAGAAREVIVESAEAGLRIAQGHADAMLALSAGDRYPFGEDEHPITYPQILTALHFDDALRVLNDWPGEQGVYVDLACRTWKRALRLLLTEKERALYMGKDGEEDGEDQPNTIHAGESARL